MSSQTPAYVDISKRLQGLREAMELTHEDMASKLGLDVEKVRLYESGTTEIPVSYLFEMAKLCHVDLTVLVSGSEAHLHNHALVRKGKGMSVERRKDYDYKSLAYGFTGRRMEPFLVRVPAKDESQLTYNEHPGQEFIHVLKGKLEIRLEDKILVLEPGDSLYFTSRTPHALRGLDGQDAEFIDVII
ncbi:helix-turn-helix domain-containing protein [Desulfonatronovibrio hydrogenovorans]|uniref:helix-turn-helix domain-containing protein n=1 Tax=Desulfonatronovibrio hydrogenovorans TaxID=53245 RepID=UPI00048FB6C6|nr:XRE family transcriptional regulator [Desulfonatronovibrio hydrogenovorans]